MNTPYPFLREHPVKGPENVESIFRLCTSPGICQITPLPLKRIPSRPSAGEHGFITRSISLQPTSPGPGPPSSGFMVVACVCISPGACFLTECVVCLLSIRLDPSPRLTTCSQNVIGSCHHGWSTGPCLLLLKQQTNRLSNCNQEVLFLLQLSSLFIT